MEDRRVSRHDKGPRIERGPFPFPSIFDLPSYIFHRRSERREFPPAPLAVPLRRIVQRAALLAFERLHPFQRARGGLASGPRGPEGPSGISGVANNSGADCRAGAAAAFVDGRAVVALEARADVDARGPSASAGGSGADVGAVAASAVGAGVLEYGVLRPSTERRNAMSSTSRFGSPTAGGSASLSSARSVSSSRWLPSRC